MYPELVVLTNYLYTETLYIFLLCLTFLLLIKGFKKQTGWLIWALAGIVLGLSILTRHVLLLFPIFLLFTCIIFKNLHVYRKKVTVFLIACYIVITPWIIRNYMHFGKFVPVASGYGGSVWIGSHLPDQGEYKYADSREKAYNASSQTTDLNEKDRILFDKAVKNVLKNPLGFGWIFLKKLGRFFFQIYNFVPDGDNRQGRSGVSVFLGLCYYPLLGLSIIGILYSRSKWKNLFPIYSMIVYTSLAYSFTIVVPRYRIPILPFFFLLASYGFFSLIKNRKKY